MRLNVLLGKSGAARTAEGTLGDGARNLVRAEDPGAHPISDPLVASFA